MFCTLRDSDDNNLAGGYFSKLNSIRGIACLYAISRRGWCVHLYGTKKDKTTKAPPSGILNSTSHVSTITPSKGPVVSHSYTNITILGILKHRLANIEVVFE